MHTTRWLELTDCVAPRSFRCRNPLSDRATTRQQDPRQEVRNQRLEGTLSCFEHVGHLALLDAL